MVTNVGNPPVQVPAVEPLNSILCFLGLGVSRPQQRVTRVHTIATYFLADPVLLNQAMILHRISRTKANRPCLAWLVSSLMIATTLHAQGLNIDVSPDLKLEAAGVTLTQIAEHPTVVTPTGIDVDADGNVWVVASHTHFRPDDYDGPEHDEVLVIGRDGSRRVFYQATTATMDLELGSDGWVYLAERSRILRVRDSNGDGIGDLEEDIAVLETQADYPHNGLSGLAWHPDGDLVFALGENYSTTWTLSASDGSAEQGTGEGGIFRCRPDGSQLRRIARGFWNPFGVCVRADGTMFAAENDPGARPPCRLLHIVEGGDYGYQRRYGNAPFHPFVGWDGELRGTLPMLHSVGEAPCGIATLGNGVLVPSWADNRIDFFPLEPQGASFATQRIALVSGNDNFRPTCIAKASETRFYLTDWVYRSYELHGFGRVWQLDIDPEAADWIGATEIPPPTEEAKLAERLRAGGQGISSEQVFQYARSRDPFLALAAIDALSLRIDQWTPQTATQLELEDQVNLLLAIRKASPQAREWVDYFWQSKDDEIRFETLRWISESDLVAYLPQVETMLRRSDSTYQLFEASLAAMNTLTGKPNAGVADAKMLSARVQDSDASPLGRAYALRLMDPTDKSITASLCEELLALAHPLLTSELAQTLSGNGAPFAQTLLRRMAIDDSLPTSVRADALSGLSPSNSESLNALMGFVDSADQVLREEALRSLRFAVLSEQQQVDLQTARATFPESEDLFAAALDPESIKRNRPPVTDTVAWRERLAGIPDPIDRQAGKRIFHHHSVGTCATCHRHQGRGRVVGPDLSAASTEGEPDRLLRSLLQPSRDVDPQYFPRSLLTEDGRVFIGILLRKGGTSGKEFYRDSTGAEQAFFKDEIVQRKELTTSMMPDGLIDLMTDREIRDVLAFLDHQPENRSEQESDSSANVFLGQWWFEFEDGYGGWLSVEEDQGEPKVELLWRVGSAKPVQSARFADGCLYLRAGNAKRGSKEYRVAVDGDTIAISQWPVAEGAELNARGKRCPPMPPRPDLSHVKFGSPIALFNGQDLNGWLLQPPSAMNGWSVRDGELVNETPKTDFSAYGSYGNLRTSDTFEDFRLHIEFNVDQERNSGIYLRGLYEIQVVDRDSPMQGIAGPGAVFGRVAPTKNAGLPGGQWQTYDLTLVDRHITVVLNGETVVDNQPVPGCTGGALLGDVNSPGPIYLQGDHTSVRYRNIMLSPRIR